MKRQRGRGRRSGGGGNNPNRHFESNGPDVKIRGSAQQILDKYLQYARDAQTSGDRVMSEAYFQHAEHYQRLLAAMQPKEKPKRDRNEDDSADDDAKSENKANGKDGGEDDASAESGDEKAAKGSADGRRRGRRTRKADDEPSENKDDPLKVVDGEEAAADAGDTPKPKRRRTYKKRETEGETTAADDHADGVMKTLSRGRSATSESSAEAEPAAE